MMNVHLLAFAGLSLTAVASPLPMATEAWEQLNPLGGEFRDQAYVCPDVGANAFTVSKTVPVCSNIVITAELVPGATFGNNYKTAAIALVESSRRYWHLAFLETPTGGHTFEQHECRDGRWLAEGDLKAEVALTKGDWKRGEKFVFSLALDGRTCEGIVRNDAGEVVFHHRFALKPGAVGCGKPAFKNYGLAVNFSRVDAVCSNAVRADLLPVEKAAAVIPPYATPATLVADGDPQKGTGFFRLARLEGGRWSFVDPEGRPFFMAAASTVNHHGDHNFQLGYAPYGRNVQRKFKGDMDAWGRSTVARLQSWGFNAVCGASEYAKYKGLPHSTIIAMGQEMASAGDAYDILPSDGGPCSAFPNVFSPKFPAFCRYVATRFCAPQRNDPWLIGYFIDNELSWWGDVRKFRHPDTGLFDVVAKKSPDHTAYRAQQEFLKARGVASAAAATKADKIEFLRLCARTYFEETTRAIRAVDPNHLILGCRYAGMGSGHPVVWEECAKCCDVISVNIYPMADLDRKCVYAGLGYRAQKMEDHIRAWTSRVDRPVIVTEWSFMALDSGRPCLHGAGQRFLTQQERAEAISLFARTLYAMPEMVGHVFFKWSDQPVCGRKGPGSENSNYGLVDEHDEPWPEVTSALAAVQLHPRESRRAAPPQPIEPPPPAPASERVRAAVRAGSAMPTFTQNADGSFELRNEAIRLAGRVGGTLYVNARGTVSPSIREDYGTSKWWSGATNVVSVAGRVENGVGVMDVVFSGRTQRRVDFRVKARFHLPAGRAFYYFELLALENAGTAAFAADQLFAKTLPIASLRVGTKEAPDAIGDVPKDGQPTPIPPSLWRPWRSGAWLCDDGRLCLAFATPRQANFQIRFWDDPDRDSLHADACYSFERTTLAPGQSFALPHPPFVAGTACEGLTAWSRIFAEIRSF